MTEEADKRYFLIGFLNFYTNGTSSGNAPVTTIGYPSHKEVHEELTRALKAPDSVMLSDRLSIVSCCEMTKQQYCKWYGVPDK